MPTTLSEIALVNRHAGKAALDETLGDLSQRRVHFDGVNLGARLHDRFDRRVGEFKNTVNQLLFGLVEDALGGALTDQ